MTNRLIAISLFLIAQFVFYWSDGIRAEKVPDVSSTLLRMHRLYTLQPPHDTTLYDILQVSPNATAAQITKSYRKLSRIYHPDKQRRKNDDDEEDRVENEQQLERIREAYEVLKTDSSRLPYHRFGLVDTVHAVYLLTGRFEDAVGRDPNLIELLHLMGYSSDHSPLPAPYIEDSQTTDVGNQVRYKQEHNQRVKFIANNIVGTIRPLVEGSVDESFLADLVVTQCDRLKKLPMGAQIIRCIGRAYRYAGRKVLRRYHANPKSFGIDSQIPFSKANLITNPALVSISDSLRDRLRHAEHVVQAAVAAGKVMISKSDTVQKANNGEEFDASIPEDWDNESGEIPDSPFTDRDDAGGLAGFLAPEEDDMRREERAKAQKAIVESLEVDALWKISKIDLDRTVRDACNMVLEGSMFFGQQEGWVGSSGLVISSNVARIRAAAAIVMIGEIMVQRSKEGTAWME
jgi:curved DNA-binding protein CbpA